MVDVAYVAGTLAFFALMIAYVHACAALGGTPSADTESR
jgi:hypothetical protein